MLEELSDDSTLLEELGVIEELPESADEDTVGTFDDVDAAAADDGTAIAAARAADELTTGSTADEDTTLEELLLADAE